MIRHSIILIAIICITCTTPIKASAGSVEEWVEEMIKVLKYYETADPIVDAERSAQDNKFYFFRAGTFATAVLAVDYWIVDNCIKDNIKIEEMLGNGDVVFGEEHVRLQTISQNYAAIFNLRMFQLLVTEKQFPCLSERLGDPNSRFQDRLSLERTIEHFPKNPTFYNHLGVLFYNEGKYIEAEKKFKVAVQLKPDSYITHNHLAMTFQKLGKLSEAKIEFEKALSQTRETRSPRWYYNWP